jgi:hypothetical protein
LHDPLSSGGGISTQFIKNQSKTEHKVLRYEVTLHNDKHAYGAVVDYGETKLAWLRGTNAFETRPDIEHLAIKPKKHDSRFFDTGQLGNQIISNLGYTIDVQCEGEIKDALMLFSRHNNAWFLNGYAASPIGRVLLKFPDGAPIFHTTTTKLVNGASTYPLSRTMRYECRVFVKQNEGIIGCDQRARDEFHRQLTLKLTGLVDASVVFYPPDAHTVTFEYGKGSTKFAPGQKQIAMHDITGELIIRW